MAFCFNQRQPILDGNVKRVLTRYFAIEGFPGRREVEQRLWQLADALTPAKRTADYTQAIMDLGATLCTRSKPGCTQCPLQRFCKAYAMDIPEQFPHRKAKKQRPVKAIQMLLFCNPEGEILLHKRPSTGIWGGLWSLPEIALEEQANLSKLIQEKADSLQLRILQTQSMDEVMHGFSHYQLRIFPKLCQVEALTLSIMDVDNLLWYNPNNPNNVGLPAVVSKLLESIAHR